MVKSLGFVGTEAGGFGVGEALTVIVVPLENIRVPPNAKNKEVSARTPSTVAAIILFRSVGVLPSKGFIA
jgi:hypothetical protein